MRFCASDFNVDCRPRSMTSQCPTVAAEARTLVVVLRRIYIRVPSRAPHDARSSVGLQRHSYVYKGAALRCKPLTLLASADFTSASPHVPTVTLPPCLLCPLYQLPRRSPRPCTVRCAIGTSSMRPRVLCTFSTRRTILSVNLAAFASLTDITAARSVSLNILCSIR